MNKQEIIDIIADYENNPGTSFDSNVLNAVRNSIFATEASLEITGEEKVLYLKKLYDLADQRGVFYMNITSKKSPVEEVEEEGDSYEEEESYEESYESSYDEDDEDEED